MYTFNFFYMFFGIGHHSIQTSFSDSLLFLLTAERLKDWEVYVALVLLTMLDQLLSFLLN